MCEPVNGAGAEGYERPNQEWSCGHSGLHRSCPLGPSRWGVCRAAGECSPRRKGEHWVCSHSGGEASGCNGPLADGTCARCVPPCRPTRSVLARRATVSLVVFALTLVSLLWLTAQPAAEQIVSPGALTPAHSSIERGCTACHDSESTWITELARSAGVNFDQSARCLSCHDLGPNARQPHSTDPAELAAVSTRAARRGKQHALLQTVVRAVTGEAHAEHGQIACSACHREHVGREHDLSRVSNERCQICHVSSFASFAHGHPDFGHYPYERRTRIHFDHQTHYLVHFADSGRIAPGAVVPDSCGTCHSGDGSGNMMLLRGYETSCSSCHDAQIRDDSLARAMGRSGPGLTFFQLPALSERVLRGGQAHLGQWPRVTNVDFATELPPYMQLLLLHDQQFQEACRTLRAESSSSSEFETALETYVWTIKELMNDLTRGGARELRQTLRTSIAAAGYDDAVADRISDVMTHSSFISVLTVAQRAWLPDLAGEVASYRKGVRIRTIEVPPKETAERAPSSSGWIQQQTDFSLRYQPVSHDDPLMRIWIEQGVSLMTESHDSPRLASETTPLLRVFDQISDPTSPGRCTKCHTVDHLGERRRVNWAANSPANAGRKRADFSHASHLVLLGKDACSDCHRLGGALELVRREFLDANWRISLQHEVVETSGFLPMPKERCSQCHAPGRARQGCLTCHDYHRSVRGEPH